MFEDALPPDFAIESGDPREPTQPLFAEEASQMASAVERRRLEFARGRFCARAALRRLGVPDAPLLSGSQREPLWPAQVVGSITHTQGLCVAAVALRSRYAGVGIDVELDEPLTPAVAERVASDAETSSLGAMPELLAARLVFSAKEAFYKCQFYRTRQFLDFFDVSIELAAQGEFSVELRVDAGPLTRGARFQGNWRRRGGFMFTALYLSH
jgi:4'-phosphopantetheinyl transferase EntD